MFTSRPKKILTIDDDEDIRSSISDRLELEGFETVWAKNGRVAIDYLKATGTEDLPDLILLDYMMPIMNGQEFCIEKAKVPRLKHIPVVMMTAGGNLINVMDRVDDEAFGYMAKPMDDETIVRMVKYFLRLPDTSSDLTESIGTDSQMLDESNGSDAKAI